VKLLLENVYFVCVCVFLSSLLYHISQVFSTVFATIKHIAHFEARLRNAEDHCAWTVANPPNGSRRRYFRRCTGKRVTSGLALCFRVRFRLLFPLLMPLV